MTSTVLIATIVALVIIGSVHCGKPTTNRTTTSPKTTHHVTTPNATGVITFNRTEDGLAWPLPDLRDFGVHLVHGQHCVEVLSEFDKNDTSELNLGHMQHCRKIAKQMLNFLVQEPTYSVQEIICEDVRTMYKHKGDAALALIVFGYGMRDGISQAELERNQNLRFRVLESQNFRNILLKQYLGQVLTTKESAYMSQLQTIYATRVSAMGTFCECRSWKAAVDKLKRIV